MIEITWIYWSRWNARGNTRFNKDEKNK